MLDLAQNRENGPIPMKEVAKRQELSLKYIEKIMPCLVRAGYVEGIHGKGGGYCLAMEPEKYTVGDILRLAEGSMAPVACLECGAKPCHRADSCKTLPMWEKFYGIINNYLDSVTLGDLLKN